MTACAGTILQPVAPQVEITQVEFTGIEFPTTKLNFHINVLNTNNFDIHIQYIDIQLHISNSLITTEHWTDINVLVAHQKQQFAVPVNINLNHAFTLIPKLMTENKIPYTINGTVKLKNYDKVLPFNYSGVFNTSSMSYEENN